MDDRSSAAVGRRRLVAGMAAFGLVGCTPASGRPDLVEGPTTTTEVGPGRMLVGPADADPISNDDATTFISSDRSIVASALPATIDVYSSPDGDVTHTMANPTPTGGQLVFLTTQNSADFHEVLLPVRPNGSLGWVSDSDVSLAAHDYRIKVDLEAFRLRVLEHGNTIFDAVVGVAADNSPTPGGRYYITELLAPPEPDTVYGSFAYGLSGFSETFETFNGGPGQLGIHGTNDPETLGTAVSSGCIRLHDDDVGHLVTFLPLGVPVDVA